MERAAHQCGGARMTSLTVGCLGLALLVLPRRSPIRLRLASLRAPEPRNRRGARPKPTLTDLELAAIWDLFGTCLRAGLPVPHAITAVTAGVDGPEMDALRSTADLLALGADPAQAWAQARAGPRTAELARAAQRTARSGSALAEVAGEMAAQLRVSAADAAEAKAQRAGVLIAGPLALCFLPAFMCLGVIPVVLGLVGGLGLF